MGDLPEETKAAAVPPVILFEHEAKRSIEVLLAWPLTVDGVRYDRARVRRLTAIEVQAFVEAVTKDGAEQLPPMIDLPAVVYDALDDDDRLALDEAISLFLPRRLRMVLEREQTSVSGEPTSPSSPTP